MHSIYNATYLVELKHSDATNLVQTMPPDAIASVDIVQFCFSCWPFSSDKFPSDLPNFGVFSFSCGTEFYHALFFKYYQSVWEIVISTHRPFAKIIRHFLQKCQESFDFFSSMNYDPMHRFEYITTMLDQWPKGSIETAVIPFPDEPLAVIFNPDYFTYVHYEPLQYFPESALKKIWLCLFTGTTLNIIAKDAVVGSRAAFSTFSLMSPLSFCDDCVLWLRENDPRMNHLHSSHYHVIVTSQKIKGISNSLTAQVRQGGQRPEYYSRLMSKCLFILLTLMNDKLTFDPYSDFVNSPITVEEIKSIIRGSAKDSLPNPEDFVAFTKTQTFRRWRHLQASRSEVRQSILSFTPKQCRFSQRSHEELKEILSGIEEFKVSSWKDEHLQAVLTLHEQKLCQEMEKFKII